MALLWRRLATGVIHRSALVATLSAAMVVTLRPAAAMDFEAKAVEGGYMLAGIGDIVQGDRVKLVTAIDSVPIGQKTLGLVLSSPGGQVIEAEKMAMTIRSSGLTAVVVSKGVCASACFLLFAAAPKKIATVDAKIGVHSVSVNSQENLASMGITTAFARDAAGYGVPGAIVARIVTTEPGQMAWLSVSELVSMGTIMVPATGGTQPTNPPRPAAPPASNLPSNIPMASAAVPFSAPSLAFQQGAADRRAWETFVASLSPDAHAGVDYWAGQRSLKKPGSCSQLPDPAPQDVAAWSGGCAAAQERLRVSDQRRRTEPDYKAGWNSL